MSLTPQEYNMLLQKGYTPQQIQQALATAEQDDDDEDDIDEAYSQAQQHNQQAGFKGYGSAFQYNPSDNLVKWQLELNDILERAEHILKEDVVKVENGRVRWISNPNQNKRIFTTEGVQEIMRILSMYVNRNTILSDYEPQEIDDKVYDFGKELSDLIFMKYEKIFVVPTFEEAKGILLESIREADNRLKFIEDLTGEVLSEEQRKDLIKKISGLYSTVMQRIEEIRHNVLKEKIRNYPMLIRQLVDIVHSSYKRALYGGEKDSLRTMRQVSQNEQLGGGISINNNPQRPERSYLNPARYVMGRYK